ncbi:MAG: hypothetical protein JO056_13925 [Alphaproteobacteria bacterium]|nr:hypothetical protein [Alphaproteobacteria bacterium]
MEKISAFYDLDRSSRAVREGRHRNIVGGMWEEIGRLQFEFLVEHGLDPHMRLIDIGCGCLRGGIHFVAYLCSGNYYGIDISGDLLDAGYDIELAPLGLQDKLPRDHLASNGEFDGAGFGVAFDMALAQSLFTHLPQDLFRKCMMRAAHYVRENGQFFVTVFISPSNHDPSQPLQHPRGGVTTFPDRDPYHYSRTQLMEIISGLPWRLETIADWDHPRDQTMLIFRRAST